MRNETELREMLHGKKVLYIATKNREYIRVNQEIELIQGVAASSLIIAYNEKSYLKRIWKVFCEVLFLDIKTYDFVVLGFMAQMVFLMFPWKFRKKTVITDFFISIYDTLIFDRKKFKENSLVAKIAKKIDSITIQKSHYCIADTRTHAAYFCEEFHTKPENIFVMYLKADTTIYYPRIVAKPEKYKNKFVVLYFGSILPVQGVDVVMGAIENLKSEKNIHFIVIGPIGSKIHKAETDNVTYIDWLSQKELAEHIAFSDLCLAGHFSDSVNKAKRTIPGKAYIYQAMGKPMVLGDTPANHELYDDKQIFIVPGNSKELSHCIYSIFIKEGRNGT